MINFGGDCLAGGNAFRFIEQDDLERQLPTARGKLLDLAQTQQFFK